MPVKRRIGKHRHDIETELDVWDDYFEFGQEGFAGDFERLGFRPGDTYHDDIRAASGQAWKSLGREWLERRKDKTFNPDWPIPTPWAVTIYGEP